MKFSRRIIYYLLLIAYGIIISVSYKSISQHGKYINLTCILPYTKHANKLTVFKANDNTSFHNTLNITNAGPEVPCYCGDTDKEYKVLLTNYSSGENEGKYRCVFYLGDNETHRHSIDVKVMPKVTIYSYLGEDGNAYYGCNRTTTKDEKSAKLYARVGSSKIDRSGSGISYNSTKNSFLLSVSVNRTEKIMCGLSYQGRSEERVINKPVSKN